MSTENPYDQPDQQDDARLYLPHSEGWEVHIKRGWQKEYCYLQKPDEDFFHLILSGEIYLQHSNEKYCLDCALRHGFITHNRLHWQQKARKSKGNIF